MGSLGAKKKGTRSLCIFKPHSSRDLILTLRYRISCWELDALLGKNSEDVSLGFSSSLKCAMVILRNKFGSPIQRRRLFIFAIREDALSKSAFDMQIDEALKREIYTMKHKHTQARNNMVPLKHVIYMSILFHISFSSLDQAVRSNLLLPNNHHAVQQDRIRRLRLREINSGRRFLFSFWRRIRKKQTEGSLKIHCTLFVS